MVEDYTPIEEFLIGQGLTERQAAEVTFKEYFLKVKFYEAKKIHDWELVRWEIFNHYILSPNLKRTDKPKRPMDLFKLPNEKEPERKAVVISEEDLQALKNIGLWG